MVHPFQMTTFPCYALAPGATPDQIRAAAARAMFDGLTLPWTPGADFSYTKSAAGKITEFTRTAGTVYTGLPYTDGACGVLTWLQYYDFETGTFNPPTDREFNHNLGNSCASAVANGWRAVIPECPFIATYSFTLSRGVIPVGDYEIDLPETDDLRHVGTKETIAKNGKEKILEAYAQCRTADLLLYVTYESNAGNHAIMVAEEPSVVRDENGKIDPERSVLIIQDQRFRSKPHEVYGEMLLISGRVRTGITFAQMISEGYIPLTHPVLTGATPYTPAKAAVSGGTPSLASWNDLVVDSNYHIIALKGVFSDERGQVLEQTKRVLLASEMKNGTTLHFPLSKMELPAAPDGAARLSLSAMVSTGEVAELFTISLQ